MLFDLGNTLWSRGEAAAWERNEDIANPRAVALLREGIDPAYLPMLDDFSLGRRLREAIDQYIRTRIRRDPENEPDGTRAVIETLSQWGVPEINRDFGTKIFEALRIRIPESRPLFDDSLSTIIELHKRGFLLGIVTNRNWGGPPFLEDLRTLGLYDYFHPAAIAISGDLGRRKPSAEIFLHALNALDVSPEEAVMVGDSLSADVRSEHGGAPKIFRLSAFSPSGSLKQSCSNGFKRLATEQIPLSTHSLLLHQECFQQNYLMMHPITRYPACTLQMMTIYWRKIGAVTISIATCAAILHPISP